jgi:hypothetical protein
MEEVMNSKIQSRATSRAVDARALDRIGLAFAAMTMVVWAIAIVLVERGLP